MKNSARSMRTHYGRNANAVLPQMQLNRNRNTDRNKDIDRNVTKNRKGFFVGASHLLLVTFLSEIIGKNKIKK